MLVACSKPQQLTNKTWSWASCLAPRLMAAFDPLLPLARGLQLVCSAPDGMVNSSGPVCGRGVKRMTIGASGDSHDKLHEAASLLEHALRLLDEANAPSHIGAHVDLGLSQLRAALGSQPF